MDTMKTNEDSNQRTDLQHKQRTIKDLIRFIKNVSYRNADKHLPTPNFSVLLGAGASVTSGIRSGQDLIMHWKTEIYKDMNDASNVGELTTEKINAFFDSTRLDWYDKSNPYSSLFEKQFDLQRQRRIFVEKEVANKNPSIGYAYLVRLIDEGYFNTIFTTNFDDLLNEAFYRYSHSRPIVCAHDSSITGVTVTSERPKIIKLHGDYLYDNIKTTLRETESLESNMRMKFQEFAKDFGLIVVGYSGQDRSIMDILTYLLQHEEYFKNGVYWCLRKQDLFHLSTELKKLLWKERVYYVLIDGFDELMAEFNNDLNNGSLPIDDSFLSWRHQEDTIRELTENKFLKESKSYILESAFNRLNKELNSSKYNDFINYLKNINEKSRDGGKNNSYKRRPERKSYLRDLSDEERQTLEEMQRNIFMASHNRTSLKVKTQLENMDILKIPDSKYKLELLQLYVDSHENLTDQQIQLYFNELIRLAPKEQKYYVIASNRIKNYQLSIKYIEDALMYFPNDAFVHEQIAELLIEHFEDAGAATLEDLQKAEGHIQRSIELDGSVRNDAYGYQARLYKFKYKNDIQILKSKQDELCTKLLEQDPHHPNVLYVLNLCNKLTEKTIKESIDFYAKADDNISLEKCYMHLLDLYAEGSTYSFSDISQIFAEYESQFEPSSSYQMRKGMLLVQYEYLQDAVDIFESLEETERVIIQKLKCYAYLEQKDKFESLYNKANKTPVIQKAYYEFSNQYEELKEYIKTNEPITSESSIGEVLEYVFILLKVGDFAEVERILKPYYDSPQYCNGVIIINYLFARQKLGKNVDGQIRNKIIDSKYIQYEDLEKIGAYGVLGDKQEMYKHLSRLLKQKPIFKYSIDTWPIMDKYRNEEKYISFMKRNPQSLREI